MNYLVCLIAVALLGGYLYTMLTCTDCPPFKEYEESLDPKQKALHRLIKKERSELFIQGFVLGIAAGLLYLYIFHGNFNVLANACIFTVIVMGVQYVYYTIMPKTAYMLPNLKNQKQIDGWFRVYKEMQYRYHLGMIIGALGFFLLSWILM